MHLCTAGCASCLNDDVYLQGPVGRKALHWPAAESGAGIAAHRYCFLHLCQFNTHCVLWANEHPLGRLSSLPCIPHGTYLLYSSVTEAGASEWHCMLL